MCGRYTITGNLAELEKLVAFICKVADFKPRYNLAPRACAPVLVWENGAATLKPMRWGLIPSWAKDETSGDKLANARAETIAEKASYRKPFEKQRCLIPADGFYEWQTTPTGKQPFRFTLKDGGFFCMAGLWEKWLRPPAGEDSTDDLFPISAPVAGATGTQVSGFSVSDSQLVETFTIITTEPNPLVAEVHNRMPVIIAPEHYQRWLVPNRFDTSFLKFLLRPFPADQMASCRVSKLVNNAKHDRPECLLPG